MEKKINVLKYISACVFSCWTIFCNFVVKWKVFLYFLELSLCIWPYELNAYVPFWYAAPLLWTHVLLGLFCFYYCVLSTVSVCTINFDTPCIEVWFDDLVESLPRRNVRSSSVRWRTIIHRKKIHTLTARAILIADQTPLVRISLYSQ